MDFKPNLKCVQDPVMKDFLEKVLEPNPDLRLGITDRGLHSLKEHELFDQVNWEKLES